MSNSSAWVLLTTVTVGAWLVVHRSRSDPVLFEKSARLISKSLGSIGTPEGLFPNEIEWRTRAIMRGARGGAKANVPLPFQFLAAWIGVLVGAGSRPRSATCGGELQASYETPPILSA